MTEDKPLLVLKVILLIDVPPTYILVESNDRNIHDECNTTTFISIDSNANNHTPNKENNSKDWNLISTDRKNHIMKALIDGGANGGIDK